jgi:hypothetical protein
MRKSRQSETREQLFSDLELKQQQCAEFSQTFLQAAQRCCHRDPGDDTLQNLKLATILQEMALEKYQRTVDVLTERLRLDKPSD